MTAKRMDGLALKPLAEWLVPPNSKPTPRFNWKRENRVQDNIGRLYEVEIVQDQ